MKSSSGNGSQTSENIIPAKAGIFVSKIGEAVTDSAVKAWEAMSGACLASRKGLLGLKFAFENQIKKIRPSAKDTWKDNKKGILMSLMNKSDSESFSLCAEAGIMGLLAMEPGDEVLELGCGDGFHAHEFYQKKAYHVTAIDSDIRSIMHASKNSSSSGITYKLCDFTRDMTVGKFDSVIWNLGPEVIAREAASHVLSMIKMRLKEGGVFAGASASSVLGSWVTGQSDIEKILSENFTNFKIKESGCSPGTFYFYASEKEIRLI